MKRIYPKNWTQEMIDRIKKKNDKAMQEINNTWDKIEKLKQQLKETK